MKKTLAIGMLALGLTTSCYAYENAAAGYKINEGTPMIVYEDRNVFGFSDYTSKSFAAIKSDNTIYTHTFIQTLSKEDMSKALGNSFSTDYFNQELEKLALDQGKHNPKELSKLADVNTYRTNNDLELLELLPKKDDEDKIIEDNVAIVVKKVGKGRALEFSNYMATNGFTVAGKSTVISANDRIYSIVTLGFIPDPKTLADEADKIGKNEEKSKEASKKETKVVAIKEEDLGAANVKKLKAAHNKAQKSLKTFVPSEKEHVFGYTDSLTKKFVKLPKDWFYITGNFTEGVAVGSVTFAGNILEIVKGFKEAGDYRTLHLDEIKDENTSGTQSSEVIKAKEQMFDESMKLFLKNLSGFKTSVSVKLNDDNIKEIFGQPLHTKLLIDQSLRDIFKKAETMNTPNFKLNKYNYSTSFTETTGKIDVETLVTLYKAFTYNTVMNCDYSAIKNTGDVRFDVSKTQLKPQAEIEVKTEPSIVTTKNSVIE